MSLLSALFGMKSFSKERRASADASKTKQTARTAASAHPANSPLLVTNEDPVTLYQADLGHYFLPKFAFESMAVRLEQGCPIFSLTFAFFREDRGGGSLAREVNHTPIPDELRRGLSPASLCAWIRQTLLDSAATDFPWDDIERMPALAAWCERVKTIDDLKLPDTLYLCPNPFSNALKDVGPDGLRDESGVGCWLAIRKGADVHEVIRGVTAWSDALSHDSVVKANLAQAPDAAIVLPNRYVYQRLAGLKRVILTSDRHLLDQISDEEKRQCQRNNITFALAFPEGLYDLIEQRDIPLTWQEWPGSADDAATYGRGA